jgi:heme exporter protein C
MIKGLWWKLLGVALFIYVLIGGMLVPLKSGITSVSPSQAAAGSSVSLEIMGYNTHFATSKDNKMWLKLDSVHLLEASKVDVVSENIAKAHFDLPDTFPTVESVPILTLVLDNTIDGGFVSPNAVFVGKKDSTDTVSSTATWIDGSKITFHKSEGIKFPYRSILNETIRNTFFHVALWFAMFVLLIIGLINALLYLSTRNMDYDIISASYNRIAIMYGVLGIVTGSIWAKYTWDSFWTTDVKLNMSAIAMLIYLAYLVLRGSTTDIDRRAKISAAYSIFAFAALIPLIFVIPRMTESLHPGNGGNPALGGEDLDNTLRLFFYPSIIALIILGLWMSKLLTRYQRIKEKIMIKNA